MPLELGGVTAHISCDGKELEAYEVTKEGDKTVTCWIASEEGKVRSFLNMINEQTFVVNWGEPSASLNISVYVYIDGRLTNDLAHTKDRSGLVEGIDDSQDRLRRFRFSPLRLTGKVVRIDNNWDLTLDDDTLAEARADHKELGSIRIVMHRVERYKRTKTQPRLLTISEIDVIHEKSKKAGVHRVSFGEAEEVERMTEAYYRPIGHEEEPFAIFIFRYRPLALLQANGIAPLPPRPSKGKKRASDVNDERNGAGPSTNKRPREEPLVKPEPEDDDEDDDVDEVTFLREQMTMLQRRLEEAEAARKARVVVKREVSPIRVPAASSPEVIDLT
ncbi:hypothetical protein FKP32DRAFT_1607917 [Trametes sanguinea]|nr:hypothetical protein FKP32DRAFT_1607917 [Trametes sanguinea]